MDRIELYPSRNRLLLAVAFGLGIGLIGYRLWDIFAAQSGGPSVTWIWPSFFFAISVVTILRAVIGLVRPRPCFICDSGGFSVMGKAPRPWTDLERVSVRSVSIAFVPAARWVSLTMRARGIRGGGQQEIPWTHLPASARETARRIERLAVTARTRAPAQSPTYDPYDPAALAEARARAG